MATGKDLLKLAQTRIGEKYANVFVPKDQPNWHGPWDCAEFASWVVFQKVGKLFGCLDNNASPSRADAYSGSWVRDVENGTLIETDRQTANNTPGVILIRKPALTTRMGHVAISDGGGGTVEAAGTGLGVKKGKLEPRLWHHFAMIPEVAYISSGAIVAPKLLPFLLTLEDPYMSGVLVKRVQRALKQAGFNPGKIDGLYGPHTLAAVFAYQSLNRLVADGIVGPLTARKLRVAWPE